MPKPGPFDPAPTAPAGTASARRDFLKAGAAAAGATLLSSCVGGGGGDAPLPLLGAPQIEPLSRFDHLVVLMFENRSFDNLLGRVRTSPFAVYDAWFCAVPSQTYCNRSFFHASTSSGHVVNEPVLKWTKNDAPTIFNRLQEAGRTWRVYCDGPHSLTSLIHWPVLSQFCASNFRTMQDFYDDAQSGTLPDYSFVEPKFGAQGNDFHPPNNVLLGEQFLHEVYTAVRNSASPTGSNALNTLLLVTFDEHGGCYDHVAPPPATSPDRIPVTGAMGFRFDRLGVRVPSIAISAYTHQNTVVNRPVHHAAVISTLCNKFGLANLTERDLGAPDLRDAINLDAPRSPASWPQTVPRPPLPAAYNAAMPVNDLERDMAALALAVARGSEPTAESLPKTVGEADAMLKALATECRVAT